MTPAGGNALRLLFWEATSACNLACRHCRRLETAQAEAERDLTAEETREMFRSAVDLGRPLVVFSGGEPLMRGDWRELAAYAGSIGLPTALATNGTLIDAETADRIAEAGFRRIAVSLDGPDRATHDEFRGVDGAFDRALAGIGALKARRQEVQINATIARHNIDSLDRLYDLARSVGAVALHLFLLVPVGCGTAIDQSHQLPAEQYERALGWLCDRQADGVLELRATCAPHYHRVAARRGLTPAGRAGRGCLCGLSVVFVGHDGQVLPCGYLPVSCGSVRERPLAEIWRSSQVLAELRDFEKLKGKCGRCDYKAVCGGCRARAFAKTGDYLAEEPSCTYEPGC